MSAVADEAATTIRRGLPADAHALAVLAAETFPLACPPTTTAENIAEHIGSHFTDEALLSELTSDGTVFYVTEDPDEHLIAFAMLVAAALPPAEIQCANPVELRRIYVTEDWHGKGISHDLIEECIRHARTHGYDLMWLGTNQENRRAIAFYGRHGFHMVGSRTFTVGDAVEDDHVMARPVDSWTSGLPLQPGRP